MEQFGQPHSERSSVRTTEYVNDILKIAQTHILESHKYKASYCRIIEVLVKKFLTEEGVEIPEESK